MRVMMAFGIASIMICLGMIFRAKISFFKKMLVPSSVIAGILGFIFMNFLWKYFGISEVNSEIYSSIVDNLFTISFISITLTQADKKNESKSVFKGALGMGIIWCLLYSLTPVVGAGVIVIFGKYFQMDAMYGTLIPFAFAQGPGQAASFGQIFEAYGWENAKMVALVFAAFGFLTAFFVGIPAVKAGIKRGIAKKCGQLEDSVQRGYLRKEEQTNYMVKDTTCSSNIETLSFHFALIGICYLLAILIAKVFSLLPGFLGNSMSGLMFMNGMYAAYIVKFVMKKLKIDFLRENILQTKITGWTADYLVVCAFMAISVEMLKSWIIPIVIEVLIIAGLTFLVCFYFGSRLGGENDFERTLGLFGTCTGTVPSGIALVRIVDPEFKTSTAVELGMMNLVMMLCTPSYIILLAMASGSMSFKLGMILLVGLSVVYLVLLKVCKCWGKKTYSWR